MTEPLDPKRGSRGLKVALAISVALNLAVAGLALGAWMKEGPPHDRLPRDLSFGPFSEALSQNDHRALRRAFLDRAPGYRAARAEARAEFAALLDAMRTRPFDAAKLQAALRAVEDRMGDRLALGRELIEARLLAMTEAERLAFADRLEKGLHRNPAN